jgi:hypothetical protein
MKWIVKKCVAVFMTPAVQEGRNTMKRFCILLGCCVALLTASVSLHAESIKTSPQMCEKRFGVQSGSQHFIIPYCRSVALSRGHGKATRAVIVIHSSSLNASSVYRYMWEAAGRAKSQGTTVVFAPQFPVFRDIKIHGLENNVPVWEDWAWAVGENSLRLGGARSTQISSFDVIDQLIRALFNRKRFPRLRHVVIVGQSAGGQFVNRYAITNGIHEAADKHGLKMRYVVMNPSHYLYLNNKRPSPISGHFMVVNAKFIEAVNHHLAPGDTPHDPNSGNCRRYNYYPKGLEVLSGYPAKRSIRTIIKKYNTRDVRYLIGALDNDRNAAGLSKKCSSDVQGLTRLTRANLYWAHMRDVYSNRITRYQKLVQVPGIGHGSENMFKHPKGGLEHIFDHR